MPRIDFYVLPESMPPLRFACTMAAKARGQGLTVHVHTSSRDEALNLDALMWTFSDISFVPHALADEGPGTAAPVVIGWDGAEPGPADVLINLATAFPAFADRYQRVVEAVAPASGPRAEARERYRRYRELGCELHSHELEAKDAHG